jgi:hypothetical protein
VLAIEIRRDLMSIMDVVVDFLNEYRLYVYGAMGLLVTMVIFKTILNRPTKEEREHKARFESLKERHKDRYRHLRKP